MRGESMSNSKKIEISDVVLESGIAVKPVYTREDVKDIDYEKDINNPGEFPFTRGIHKFMYRARPWTMRQYSGFATATETNKRFKYKCRVTLFVVLYLHSLAPLLFLCRSDSL